MGPEVREAWPIEDFPNSRDGYHVRRWEDPVNKEISLWLELTIDGVVQQQHSRKIWWASRSTPMTLGLRDQACAIAEALARFLNTGGNVGLLDTMLREIWDLPTIDWNHKGFYLFTTRQEAEARHIFFAKQGEGAVEWQEGVIVVERSVADVLDELEDEEEEAEDEEEDLQHS